MPLTAQELLQSTTDVFSEVLVTFPFFSRPYANVLRKGYPA